MKECSLEKNKQACNRKSNRQRKDKIHRPGLSHQRNQIRSYFNDGNDCPVPGTDTGADEDDQKKYAG